MEYGPRDVPQEAALQKSDGGLPSGARGPGPPKPARREGYKPVVTAEVNARSWAWIV
jgi:hypothetical protein